MVTTINYKNGQIFFFTSGTKTLKTSRKFIEDDVTFTTTSGSVATTTIIITVNPAIIVNVIGLITADIAASQNITLTVSAGYVVVDTSGTVSVTGRNSQQMTTKGAIHPV